MLVGPVCPLYGGLAPVGVMVPLGEERQWCYPKRPASCRGRGHDDKEARDEGDHRGQRERVLSPDGAPKVDGQLWSLLSLGQ